jgi:hypothetical protein
MWALANSTTDRKSDDLAKLLTEIIIALPGIHRPGHVPHPRQGPGHGPVLRALRQRSRGKVRKADRVPVLLGMIEEEPRPVPSKGWAGMIRKVYEVDPMVCPHCGGRMKVVAFLTDYAVVDRIMEHLKLIFVAEKPPPSHVFIEVALMTAEGSKDYE